MAPRAQGRDREDAANKGFSGGAAGARELERKERHRGSNGKGVDGHSRDAVTERREEPAGEWSGTRAVKKPKGAGSPQRPESGKDGVMFALKAHLSGN